MSYSLNIVIDLGDDAEKAIRDGFMLVTKINDYSDSPINATYAIEDDDSVILEGKTF